MLSSTADTLINNVINDEQRRNKQGRIKCYKHIYRVSDAEFVKMDAFFLYHCAWPSASLACAVIQNKRLNIQLIVQSLLHSSGK